MIHSKIRRMEVDNTVFEHSNISPDPFASDEDDEVDNAQPKKSLYSKYLSTLEQERQDALLAKQLQDQLNDEARLNKTYQLRTRSSEKKKSAQMRGGRGLANQPTLRETLRRAAASTANKSKG
jgi:hypothetical protein